MMNKQKLVKSGLWQLMNTAVIFISQLGYYAIMARLIENAKAAFGVLALLNACINFGNVVAEAGMGDALLQRKVVEPGHKNAALYYSIATAVFFYIVLFFLAPIIAHFFDQPILTFSLRMIGLTFILYSLGSPSINLLQKEFQFKKIFFSDSLSLLASNVLGIFLAWKGFGVMSLVYSTLFYNTAKLIMLWIMEPLPLQMGATLQHWKDLFNYGMILTLIRITNYFNTSGINFLIGKLVPIGALGIFERSSRTVNLPGRYVGDIVQKISLPAMIKIETTDALFVMYYKTLSLLHSILVPLSVFFAVFSKPLVLILLGPRWLDAVVPLHFMFLALPFQIEARLADGVMRVKGLLVDNLKRKILAMCIVFASIFAGSYYAAPLQGIAVGMLAAAITNYYIMILTLRNKVFPDDWKKLLLRPFLNGIPLTIYLVIPSFLIYLLCLFVTNNDDVISFLITCSIVGGFLAYCFFKKPKLLGKDFAPIQTILMEIMNKKKRGGKKRKTEEPELEMAPRE